MIHPVVSFFYFSGWKKFPFHFYQCEELPFQKMYSYSLFSLKLSHALLPLGNIQTLKQFFKLRLSPLDFFLKFNSIDF